MLFHFFWKGNVEKTMYSYNMGTIYKKMLSSYDDFIVIHESHLVNCRHIINYNSKKHSVKMADNTSIRIAERRLSDFLQKFNVR